MAATLPDWYRLVPLAYGRSPAMSRSSIRPVCSASAVVGARDHAPNVLLIPGTATIAHLEDNVAAGDLVLDGAARAARRRHAVTTAGCRR
jgi:hypothetical protein